MVKKSLLKKVHRGMLALTLLTVSPILFTQSVFAVTQTEAKQRLFASLRKFVFNTRSVGKSWANLCKEWIEILQDLPEYAPLKAQLQKASKFKNPASIGVALKNAIAPYVNEIPSDILQRVAELDERGMINLITASLNGQTPNVPESKIQMSE